jgi:hypothetical protein
MLDFALVLLTYFCITQSTAVGQMNEFFKPVFVAHISTFPIARIVCFLVLIA